MFVLLRAPIRDYWIVELNRSWLRLSEDKKDNEIETPPVMFSLANWQTSLEEGTVAPSEIPFPKQEMPEWLSALRSSQLDFVDFDSVGSLYTGSMEQNLVLKFELDRPSGLYAVGVSGGVTMDGINGTARVKIHAWKKTHLGL